MSCDPVRGLDGAVLRLALIQLRSVLTVCEVLNYKDDHCGDEQQRQYEQHRLQELPDSVDQSFSPSNFLSLSSKSFCASWATACQCASLSPSTALIAARAIVTQQSSAWGL